MKTKKELKQAYKQRTSNRGVFQIRNLTNDKIWVEGSLDMAARWNRHRTELRFGSHRNHDLQEDWKTSGAENFVFEILATLEDENEKELNYQEELKVLEEMILEEKQPFGEKGYNKNQR